MVNSEELTTFTPEEKSDYYVYGLANPLKPTKKSYVGGVSLHEYEYFYFGFSGDEKRLDQHLKCSDTDKNYHKKNTIRKIQRNNLEVIFVKILIDADKQTAIDKEIEMIAYYGRKNKGLGPLTNMTDGGEGGGHNIINITGQKFNMLTVLKHVKGNKWLCRCDCGTEKVMRNSDFKSGKSKSCGCQHGTHGKTKTPEYKLWGNMKNWCYNTSHNSYSYYGGRGIKVCESWKESFENFYEDMGDRPTDKHILRRKDTKDNFEPNNCEWSC